MTDDQAVRLKTITQEQEPFFFPGVIRVIDQAGALIQKNSLSFLERDAVLYQVGSSLALIPGKLNIAHTGILAIPSPAAEGARK